MPLFDAEVKAYRSLIRSLLGHIEEYLFIKEKGSKVHLMRLPLFLCNLELLVEHLNHSLQNCTDLMYGLSSTHLQLLAQQDLLPSFEHLCLHLKLSLPVSLRLSEKPQAASS